MEGQGHPARPTLLKRIHTTHNDAATALLHCTLPPELGVGYRNSSSSQLRSSVSESNVSSPTVASSQLKSAFRTLSDGQSSLHLFRRKLESEDSSYDSDYECLPQLTSCILQHEDVLRTVSDTLDQELGDESSALATDDPQSAHCDKDYESSDTELLNPEFVHFYKFAVKLGYTQQQAWTVLNKLGVNPEENEFLSGLIQLDKLTSSCPPIVKCIEIPEETSTLRYIVIDGSNVAMTHGNKEKFSCRGIQICVDWFLARGHTYITVLVPKWRKEASTVEAPITDQKILLDLERDKLLTFTPSRQSPDGRRIICYDDRYILQVARDNDAIIVSNDNYRDLALESPEFRPIIEKRILMYSFVNDRFMPPEDPLGRNGPKLDAFLRKSLPQPCPYTIRCTYGNKCKYYHPERINNPHKPISEQLSDKLREVGTKKKVSRENSAAADFIKPLKKPVQRAVTNSPNRSLPLSLVEERPVRDSHQSPPVSRGSCQSYRAINLPQFPLTPSRPLPEEPHNPHLQITRQSSFHPL